MLFRHSAEGGEGPRSTEGDDPEATCVFLGALLWSCHRLGGWDEVTGWFLPLPFLAWSAIHRSRRGLITVILGGIVSLVTVYIFTPPWWGDPILGVERFFRSNLTRGSTQPIPTQFLGQVDETPNGSLPWYNTLVWTAMATPVGFLALVVR